MIIGIDAGHGFGNRLPGVFDPGAVHGGIREADIALSVALMLQDECRRRGWATAMTRTTNGQACPLSSRVPKLRSADADCIVSIHCNAYSTAQANGTETYYLAAQWVALAVQRKAVAALGTRDRGAKQRDDLALLRYERPAILVELAFLSNDSDRALLVDEGCQLAAARAIADGLAESVRP